MQFRFEDYALDIERRELRRGAQQIAVGPQVFDLLVYLVQNRERVVTKDDLLDAVWSGRFVSESNLTTRINAARKAIGDSGEEQRLIRTVPRKGFRFVGVVSTAAENARDAPTSTAPTGMPLPLPDKPSIAVLPFQNMSGDPEQEYFADGVVEEIITALSRVHWLFVIARNSSFTYKGRAVDIKLVGRELGVRYVLEGSVRKASNRVRITGQLVDATTGAHVWANRFDGALARNYGMVTEFGTMADPIADKTLIGAALIGLSMLGDLPWWVTVLILAREVGITVLRFVVLRRGVIPASRGGKLKTLVQAVAIGLFILPLSGSWLVVASIVMGAAILLTVVTGVD